MTVISDPRPEGRGVLVLALASVGCSLTVLDTNVVGIVLPAIARDLHATFADIEWVVSSYVLFFAALLLPAGIMADRYGRKLAFLYGVAIFGLSSLACGWATSATLLAVARAIQGAGAAFVIAPALAIIGHRFHDDRERSHAWAVWGSAMGLTMVLSPLIGGLISSEFGWRWAFFINVPICGALLIVAYRYIDESRSPEHRSLDLPGIALFIMGMLFVTWAIILGPRAGWTSVGVVSRGALGAILFALFCVVELRRKEPMLDLRLFRSPLLAGAVVAMFAYAASAQVMASLLPLYLQGALGDSPLGAGVAMLPFALTMLIFPRVGKRLGQHWASYQILTAGLLTVGCGNLLLAFAAVRQQSVFVAIAMAVLGAGGGLLNGETQKAVMAQVPRHRSGMASGISTTSRFTGILLGFSVLGALLAAMTRELLGRDAALTSVFGMAPSPELVDSVVSGDVEHAFGTGTGRATSGLVEAARLDYGHAFAATFSIAAIVAAIGAGVVFLAMRRSRPRSA